MSTSFKICNCNRSMPLPPNAGDRLGDALNAQTITVSAHLCGRDTQKYLSALGGGETVIVGCTQEKPLFDELAREANALAPVRFVNLKDSLGARGQADRSLPKMAALLADAALPAADPVPAVSYASQGRTLILGPADTALHWAETLHEQLQVQVLITDAAGGSGLPAQRRYPVLSGSEVEIDGWLGTFTVSWSQDNPIDLDLCVRCNACVAACPESAITMLYQVDADKCGRHGECVAACGQVGAIDFNRPASRRSGAFDLILDLSAQAVIPLHQPPYGYFHAAGNDKATFDAVLRLLQMTGEYEKPKYFQYREKLCTHSRNEKTGCKACIDICSAQAIRSEGNHVRVEPHLCAGCGACTTVCPSGAISYAYPGAPHTGKRLKTMLQSYAKAGGERAGVLFHGSGNAAELIGRLGRLADAGRMESGIPPHLMPLELHHAASAGIELWLSAIAYGATSVAVLATRDDAPPYVAALKQQMTIAQMILSGLGYAGRHLQLIEANTPEELESALQALPQGAIPAQAASFNVFAEKRTTLDFVFEHLLRHAPVRNETIALIPGAPFGTLKVNADACTLCMACTGACPTSALISTPDRPQLRFIEKNCVQCGLCAATCPENAIALQPRLNLSEAARQPVVLNETQPFECIRCHQPFGTLKMVEGMLARLSGHAAFAGNLDRLRMCGDCRVIDMMEAKNRALVTEVQRTP